MRAFNRAMARGDAEEACAKLADYDAHHFTDPGAAADRAVMVAQARALPLASRACLPVQ